MQLGRSLAKPPRLGRAQFPCRKYEPGQTPPSAAQGKIGFRRSPALALGYALQVPTAVNFKKFGTWEIYIINKTPEPLRNFAGLSC